MHDFFVYMLLCIDDALYIGVTNHVEKRVWQHQCGIDPGCFTFNRRPIHLVYVATFTDIRDAIAWENRSKRWSRKKKEALIAGNGEELHRLAECQNDSHAKNKNVMVSGDEP